VGGSRRNAPKSSTALTGRQIRKLRRRKKSRMGAAEKERTEGKGRESPWARRVGEAAGRLMPASHEGRNAEKAHRGEPIEKREKHRTGTKRGQENIWKHFVPKAHGGAGGKAWCQTKGSRGEEKTENNQEKTEGRSAGPTVNGTSQKQLHCQRGARVEGSHTTRGQACHKSTEVPSESGFQDTRKDRRKGNNGGKTRADKKRPGRKKIYSHQPWGTNRLMGERGKGEGAPAQRATGG